MKGLSNTLSVDVWVTLNRSSVLRADRHRCGWPQRTAAAISGWFPGGAPIAIHKSARLLPGAIRSSNPSGEAGPSSQVGRCGGGRGRRRATRPAGTGRRAQATGGQIVLSWSSIAADGACSSPRRTNGGRTDRRGQRRYRAELVDAWAPRREGSAEAPGRRSEGAAGSAAWKGALIGPRGYPRSRSGCRAARRAATGTVNQVSGSCGRKLRRSDSNTNGPAAPGGRHALGAGA